MNIECSKKELLKCLKEVELTVNKKKNRSEELWNSVLLEAKGKKLIVKTCSGEQSSIIEVLVDVYEEGMCSILVNKFVDIVSGFPADRVKLSRRFSDEDGKDVIDISAPESESTSVVYSLFIANREETERHHRILPKEEDWLSFQEFQKDKDWVTLSESDLVSILKSVSSAREKKGIKYEFTGVYFNKTGDKLDVCATDGKRLAVCTLPTHKFEMSKKDFSHIAPGDWVDILLKKLSKSKKSKTANVKHTIYFNGRSMGVITVEYSKTVCNLSKTNSLSSYVMDVNFPDYQRLSIENFQEIPTIRFDRKELIDAVKRIAPVCDSKDLKMKMEITKEKIVLSSGSGDNTGEDEVSFIDDNVLSDRVIGFNYKYVLDILKAISTETIIMYHDDKPLMRAKTQEELDSEKEAIEHNDNISDKEKAIANIETAETIADMCPMWFAPGYDDEADYKVCITLMPMTL